MALLGRRRKTSVNPNNLTGAGRLITRDDVDSVRRVYQPWQDRSFEYYNGGGPAWYASQFYARMLAPLRLVPMEKNEDGDLVESENEIAITQLERVQDPGGGRANLLATYGRLMFLAGEALLFVSLDAEGNEQWEMLSHKELIIEDRTYRRVPGPALPSYEYMRPTGDSTSLQRGEGVAFRLWRRHPQWSALADSPMRSALDDLEEHTMLTRAVRARSRSRTAGKGVWLLDDRISKAPLEPAPDEDPLEDVFLSNLIQALTASMANEGVASEAVPMLVRVPVPDGMKISDMSHFLSFTDPNELYQEAGLRMETIRRIAIDLDMPPEVLTGTADLNHWCVDEQTEILTRDRGWITQDSLRQGDEVRTLDHDSGYASWKPVLDIYRADVHDEPMRHFESRTHSSLTTLNHRWPVIRPRWADGVPGPTAEWTTTAELTAACSILTAAQSGDAPVEGIYTDDFVELVGWFWTEGHTAAGMASIAQSHTANLDRVTRIRALLRRLFGPARQTLRASGDGPAWREKVQSNEDSHGGPITVFYLNSVITNRLNEVAPMKLVNSDFICSLTRAQLELFIDVSCQADGHHYRTGELDIWQRNPAALDAFELALILSGRAASRQPSHDQGTVVRGLRSTSVRPVKAAEQMARQAAGGAGATDEIVSYSGTVWCPVTPNGTWLARREGRVFYTGNSAWLVDENTWKGHGEPVANQLVDDLSAAYYRPTLKALGVENWSDHYIGYDESGVVNHPDRSKDAKDLHDRLAISDDALRDANNFTEEDAIQDQQEWDRRVGILIRDGSLAVYGIPSVKSGGIEPQQGEVEKGPSSGGTVDSGQSSPEAPKGTPAQPGTNEKQDTQASANGHNNLAAMLVQGAAQGALIRAREAAGNRLLSLAKRSSPEVQEKLKGVRTPDVALVLGKEEVRRLGAPAERELVKGAHNVLLLSLHSWGIQDPELCEQIVQAVEQYAARTLYEPPARIPPSLSSYLAGLVSGVAQA